MAAGTIKVSTDVLRATASSFEGTASTVQNLTQNMTSIVTSLTGAIWTSESETAFINKFNGLQDDMNRIYKMIVEHSEDLISIAQQYETAETTNADLANSLSSDVIV